MQFVWEMYHLDGYFCLFRTKIGKNIHILTDILTIIPGNFLYSIPGNSIVIWFHLWGRGWDLVVQGSLTLGRERTICNNTNEDVW